MCIPRDCSPAFPQALPQGFLSATGNAVCADPPASCRRDRNGARLPTAASRARLSPGVCELPRRRPWRGTDRRDVTGQECGVSTRRVA